METWLIVLVSAVVVMCVVFVYFWWWKPHTRMQNTRKQLQAKRDHLTRELQQLLEKADEFVVDGSGAILRRTNSYYSTSFADEPLTAEDTAVFKQKTKAIEDIDAQMEAL